MTSVPNKPITGRAPGRALTAPARSRARRQRGLSMIEVLVAIVVLSIGLLGLAGLQANGIKVNQGATFRWKASQLAADLADRMRADQAGFNAAASVANPCVIAAGAAVGTGPCPGGFSATTLADWATNQLTALPGGQAAVMATDTAGDWQVYVAWNDLRAVDASGASGTVAPTQCPAALGNPTGCFVLTTRISS